MIHTDRDISSGKFVAQILKHMTFIF